MMSEASAQTHQTQAKHLENAPLSEPQVCAATAQQPISSGPANTLPEPSASRLNMRRGLFLLLPITLLALGALYVLGGQVISTDNAYIQADHVGVSTDVAGIVEAVEVTDNQLVSKGQVLFRLRPEPFEIALKNAEAQLGEVRNQLMNYKASYAQAQAEITQAQSEIPYYEKNLARLNTLVSISAVSKTQYDDAKHNLQTTQQKVAVAKAQAQATLAQLSGNVDLPLEQQPRYMQAQAKVDEAQRNLKNSVVVAPFAGIVTHVDSLAAGAYLQPPQSGFSLISTEHVWVAASPKETELTHMQPGQPVVINVDAYPGVTWHGTVDSISPASSSSFSLLPAQNTTGNWVKVVQRIPVRIRIDDASGKPPLRHGMSVEAGIDTGHARGVPELLSSLWIGKAQANE